MNFEELLLLGVDSPVLMFLVRSIKEESQWKIKLRGLMLSSANTRNRSKEQDLVLLKKLLKLVLWEFSSKRRCEWLSVLSSRMWSACFWYGFGFNTNCYPFCLGMKDNVTCFTIRLSTLIKYHLLLKASKMLNKLYVSIKFFLIFLVKKSTLNQNLMCFWYESYDSWCTWMCRWQR